MPREGEVIKPDPAAASRKKALRPRAACPRLCCREGSARSCRLQRVAKACLSIAGVPRRSLQCRAHLQNTQLVPRRSKPKGDGATKELPRSAAAASVSTRRGTGGSGTALARFPPRRMEQVQHPYTWDKALGTQPPLRALRKKGRASDSPDPNRDRGDGETSQAVLRRREPVSFSSVFITACRKASRQEPPKSPRTKGSPSCPAERCLREPRAALPRPGPGRKLPGAGRDGAGRAGPGSPRRPELSVVLRARSWRLPGQEGPGQPHSVRAAAWCGGKLPWGLPRPYRSHTALPHLTVCFHAQLTNSQVYSGGCRNSRGLRLREPIHLSTDGFVYLFTSTSRDENRSWPGLERDRDCKNSAARHHVWGWPRGKQLSGEERGQNPNGTAGKARPPTAPNCQWCPVLRHAPR